MQSKSSHPSGPYSPLCDFYRKPTITLCKRSSAQSELHTMDDLIFWVSYWNVKKNNSTGYRLYLTLTKDLILLCFIVFCSCLVYDDVTKWKHFPRNWPFVRGIHQSPVNSLHKGQWRGALMFCLIYAWINGWVNNREAGDLRRHRVHYDVTVMNGWYYPHPWVLHQS